MTNWPKAGETLVRGSDYDALKADNERLRQLLREAMSYGIPADLWREIDVALSAPDEATVALDSNR